MNHDIFCDIFNLGCTNFLLGVQNYAKSNTLEVVCHLSQSNILKNVREFKIQCCKTVAVDRKVHSLWCTGHQSPSLW